MNVYICTTKSNLSDNVYHYIIFAECSEEAINGLRKRFPNLNKDWTFEEVIPQRGEPYYVSREVLCL